MLSPINTALSVWESCTNTLYHRLCESYKCREVGQFCCGSDPPLEVISELQQRQDASVRMDKLAVRDRSVSVHA